MKVTMEKIAELAGVSLSTVSRSLNDSPEISQKTKARIRDICAKYGYNVNAAASSLRRQSPGSLGLVIPFAGAVKGDFNSPFILEMVGKITAISAEHGYDVIVSLSHQLGRLSKQKLYAAGKVDALTVQVDLQQRLLMSTLDAVMAQLRELGLSMASMQSDMSSMRSELQQLQSTVNGGKADGGGGGGGKKRIDA